MRWKLIAVSSLTGVRLIESPFLVLYAFYGDWSVVMVLLATGVASDFYDGVIARGWGVVTKFGFWLDTLFDRVFLLAPLLGMSLGGIVPLWLFATLAFCIIFTDVRARRIGRPNMLQMACWWIIMGLIAAVIIHETSIAFVTTWAAAFLLLYLPLMFFKEKREELKGWIRLITRKKDQTR